MFNVSIKNVIVDEEINKDIDGLTGSVYEATCETILISTLATKSV